MMTSIAPPEAPTSAMDAGPALQHRTDVSFRAAPKSRQGYTRQRQGCLTCRRRKKKCDRCYPLCGHCFRLNLACEREEPRRVGPSLETDKSSNRALSIAPADQHDGHVSRLYAAIDYTVLRDETSHVDLVSSRRAILRYYTTVFASLISTNHENNCFLSVMLPMAFECSTLMKSLVAWASSHLATRDASLQHTALEHRGSALNALKASIDQNELSSEMCLAIAMVFCSMESISDTTGSWYHHLLGGAAALGQPGGSPGSSDLGNYTPIQAQLSRIEGGWLLRNFAYHDALMSVALDRRPLITGHYWMTTDSAWVDPYFGLASRIIYLISQISVLSANLTQYAGSTSLSERAFAIHPSTSVEAGSSTAYPPPQSQAEPRSFSDAYDIETELLNWTCPDGFANSSLRLLAEAYRSAALLHLYRTLRRHGADILGQLKEKISSQVSSMCNLVAQMPDGCLEECTLLFPLFIAGGEAVSSTHIETICDKMEMINQYRHFRNVNQALEVLNELWRLRIAGASGTNNRDLDWLDITKSRNIKLAIT